MLVCFEQGHKSSRGKSPAFFSRLFQAEKMKKRERVLTKKVCAADCNKQPLHVPPASEINELNQAGSGKPRRNRPSIPNGMTESEAKPLPQVIYLDVLLACQFVCQLFSAAWHLLFFQPKSQTLSDGSVRAYGQPFFCFNSVRRSPPPVVVGNQTRSGLSADPDRFRVWHFHSLSEAHADRSSPVNFVFAGAMTALFVFASPKGMVIRNGTVYFNISALALVLGTVAAYGIIKLVTYLFRQKNTAA